MATPLAPDAGWSPPPEPLTLQHDDVHVWRAWLDVGPYARDSFERVLGHQERMKAGRMRFQIHRERYIAAHGILRSILSRYLRTEPCAVEYTHSAYGKPALLLRDGWPDLRFNMSHAGGMALYAVTMGREVGVDVEPIRKDFAGERIATRFFSAGEVKQLLELPPPDRLRAFFLCWTRKEAYIKASGEGLRIDLNSFEVSLHPDAPAELLRSDRGGDEVRRWRLENLLPGESYCGAIAVEGETWRHRCWQWGKTSPCGAVRSD